MEIAEVIEILFVGKHDPLLGLGGAALAAPPPPMMARVGFAPRFPRNDEFHDTAPFIRLDRIGAKTLNTRSALGRAPLVKRVAVEHRAIDRVGLGHARARSNRR